MEYEIIIPSLIIAGALTYYVMRAFRTRKRLMMFAFMADRWGMRFYSDVYSGLKGSLTGSYYGSLGHTRSGSAVLSGRQLNIPLAISDYRYELGSGLGREVRKSTVFIAELPEKMPPLLVLHKGELLPLGHFADYGQLDMQPFFNQPGIESAVRCYLRKCRFYSARSDLVGQKLNPELINALGKIKLADMELMDNKLIIWSEPVKSKYRLIQLAARLVAAARVIDNSSDRSVTGREQLQS